MRGEAETDGQSIVQQWETDSGVAIVPPEASTGTADVEVPSVQSDTASVESETEEAGSRWAPPAEVAALYYPKEPLEETTAELAPSSTTESSSSGQTVSGGETVSVSTGRLDTRQVDDAPSFSCAETANRRDDGHAGDSRRGRPW